MSNPRRTWMFFGLALCLALAAMGWISAEVLRLDRETQRAQRQAARQEKIRLALWRMESKLVPLLGNESARPKEQYQPFYAAPQAYTKLFTQIKTGRVQLPSPLLSRQIQFIKLHFQVTPRGLFTSPQVPRGNERDLAESLYSSHTKIEAAARTLEQLQTLVRGNQIWKKMGANQTPAAPPQQRAILTESNEPIENVRQEVTQFAARSQQSSQNIENLISANPFRSGKVSAPATELMTPFWLGKELFMARQISTDKKEKCIQGCWLDWPAIRKDLLDEIKEDLPRARLQARTGAPTSSRACLLAALPIKLLPGKLTLPPNAALTPNQITLIVAWVCTLLAAISVWVLLRSALTLSERRGAFVSAVTHELRTPLTTFQMYTEMLAEGMVPDADKRRHYLETLRAESVRLGHLVENVLTYARLEKTNGAGPSLPVVFGEFLDRTRARLAERAGQAGLELQVSGAEESLSAKAQMDPEAVERILFNLVDNAAKYAAGARNKSLHLEISATAKQVICRVRDHGPGIPPEDLVRLFRPFSKSAQEAAHSAPGVGLGLALCRGLARKMQGELQLDRASKEGATFVLTLPRV